MKRKTTRDVSPNSGGTEIGGRSLTENLVEKSLRLKSELHGF